MITVGILLFVASFVCIFLLYFTILSYSSKTVCKNTILFNDVDKPVFSLKDSA